MAPFISAQSVSVNNLAELRKALKAIADPKLTRKAFRDANYTVSMKVLTLAQAAAIASGDKARAVAAGTLKARRTEAEATISLGSDEVPQALGEEFGAKHNVMRENGRRGWNQFPEFKGEGQGYFLLPSIGKVAESDIGDGYLDALEGMINKFMK